MAPTELFAEPPPNAHGGNPSGDDGISFGDSETSDDDYEGDPEVTLDSIDKSHTIKFPVRSNYSWRWGPVEAFRELVQNWRDAIVKSFDIPESEFKVTREERTNGRNAEIIFKVARPNSNPEECLGYIRWKGRDGSGTVEVINRRATLLPWHLDMGGTSKAGDRRQAGAHGEGLKIALLVFQRGQQNHCVQCFTGSFKWNFNFTNQGRLVARLRRMTEKQEWSSRNTAQNELQKGSIPFAPSPSRDVRFVIGQPAKGRNESGFETKRKQVTRGDFNLWCKAALFLQDVEDGGIISTKVGALITDKRMCGNIYLKGLLLDETTKQYSASITGKPLKFGYNFADGVTNRERQSMSSSKDESKAIFRIWDMVLTACPTLVTELHAMLNHQDPEYADVSLAKESIQIDTVARLKSHLFSDGCTWYFSSQERSENPALNVVLDGLVRKGVELQDPYWAILAAHGLVRTAEEEQRKRFQSAKACPIPNNSFAQQCDRILRACLRGCPQTDGIQTEFVEAGRLRLHTFYSASGNTRCLKVHGQWLDIRRCIHELGLHKALGECDILFHVVRQLFSEALDQISDSQFFKKDSGHTASWYRKRERSRADQRILEYTRLRLARACATAIAGEVRVHHDFLPSVPKKIQLHFVNVCSHLMKSLVSRDVPSVCNGSLGTEGAVSAGQPSGQTNPKKCYQNDTGLFRGLAGDQEYFAVIFRPLEPNSIVVFTNVINIPTRTSLSTTISTPNGCSQRQTDNDGSVGLPENPTASSRARSPSAIDSLSLVTERDRADSSEAYVPERRIESLDILEPREWYETTGSARGRVVIGVPKEKDNTQTGQKRPRFEGGD